MAPSILKCLFSALLTCSVSVPVAAQETIEQAMIDAFATCSAWAERGRPVPDDIWQKYEISEHYDLTGSATWIHNEYRSFSDSRVMLTAGLQERRTPPSDEPNMRWCSVDVVSEHVGDIAPSVVAAWSDMADGYDLWYSLLDEFRAGGEEFLDPDTVGEHIFLRRCDDDVVSSITVVEVFPSESGSDGSRDFTEGRLGATIQYIPSPLSRDPFDCDAS